MTRRSWRDLEDPAAATTTPGSGSRPGPGITPSERAGGAPSDLHRAAELAPDSRLGHLLQQREALERRLRGLVGQGSSDQDPAIAARFPVQSFAERRAEQQALDARRERTRQEQETAPLRPALRQAAEPGGEVPGMPDTPLAARMSAGLPQIATTALGQPVARSGVTRRSTELRNRFAERSGAARNELLAPARRATRPLDEAGRPLRDFGRQLSDTRGQMADLDRKLAEEGVSEAEREEIRRSMGGDTLDKVGARVEKANEVLNAPKRLVDKVDRFWQARERDITGPMDRFSSYAERRERRLSTETGGSGDLFERMLRNGQRALARRREAQQQEERDQRRRDAAASRGRERRAQERRNERED